MNVTIWEFSLFKMEDAVGVTAGKTSLRPNETTQLSISGQLGTGQPITPEMIEAVTYYTDREDLVTIHTDGSLRMEDFTEEASFHVWAEVTVNGNTLTTDKLAFSASVLGENLALNKNVSASSFHPNYEASKAVDGNDRTRWASKRDEPEYWIEIDLGAETELNRMQFQVYSDRSDPANYEVYNHFKIQYWKDGAWRMPAFFRSGTPDYLSGLRRNRKL